MIMPHATGHVFASDGRLLRVDVIAGQCVARRFGPNLVVTQRVVGPTTRCIDRSSSGGDGLALITGRESRSVRADSEMQMQRSAARKKSR